MLPFIRMKVLLKIEREGQRKMLSVIIAIKRGIIKQTVGLKEEGRKGKGRN